MILLGTCGQHYSLNCYAWTFCQKHPNAENPKASFLVMCDALPLLEDVEITGLQNLSFAHCIHSGVRLGDCDASH